MVSLQLNTVSDSIVIINNWRWWVIFGKLNFVVVPAPSREMIEAYRRRRSMLQHPSHKRPQVIEDSDDEYDSEMEGFIDDEEDEEEGRL